MRRLSVLCAALGIVATALAASPAQAAYNVIRWDNTGWCQVWDPATPLTPLFSKYAAVNKKPIPTLTAALAEKDAMVKKGACKL